MSLGGVVSLVSPNFKFYYSVCAWHWKFCLLTFMLQDTRGLIMHAAERAGGQREMLLITLKCTFGWTWPRLSDSGVFFFLPHLLQVQLSAVTPPPSAPAVPTGLEDSLSGLSISAAPPTMPSELQTGHCSHPFSPHTIQLAILKYFVFSEFLFHHVNVLPPSSIQVCPQYPCSPPPPAPPSTPSHLWIPPPAASTPPPRYQVGAFYAYFTETW